MCIIHKNTYITLHYSTVQYIAIHYIHDITLYYIHTYTHTYIYIYIRMRKYICVYINDTCIYTISKNNRYLWNFMPGIKFSTATSCCSWGSVPPPDPWECAHGRLAAPEALVLGILWLPLSLPVSCSMWKNCPCRKNENLSIQNCDFPAMLEGVVMFFGI